MPSVLENMQVWSLKDSKDLYNISNWGLGFFDVNEKGHVTVYPRGPEAPGIDLLELVTELQRREIQLPILIRFSDILRTRVAQLNEAFRKAISEYGYKNRYAGVYPIKVNQHRQVVEEILLYGAPYDFGLEAGSKSELMAVIPLVSSPSQLIICNGYKDAEYIEMTCLSTKMGKTIIPVIEKFTEVELILQQARRLGVRPRIGIRAKLSSRGSGKWHESGGDRSKFGLNITEILRAIDALREAEMLDCLQLLHFHLGSQITNIRHIRDAMGEATRLYVELKKLGANMQYLDVGGGLAVDYDGSQTSFESSSNYSLQEYANDVVAGVMDVCDKAGTDHPTIVTESGRAITAHHSVLVFDILGAHSFGDVEVPKELPPGTPDVLLSLHEAYRNVNKKNFQEVYHDALHYQNEAVSLFNLGFLDLNARALAETIAHATAQKILRLMRERTYVPDELEGLQKALADTYFCNFSMFQSVPDFWMVHQLFPVMPIHRLNEEPTRRAVLCDITCDSDGKLDKFIDLHDVKDTIELHPLNGGDYVLGIFLLGAYQEILGDLHNLFGDTNAVHVRLADDESGGYEVDHFVRGDTVREVLSYVQWKVDDLVSQLRRQAEAAVKAGRMTLEESAKLMRRYESNLRGYTYLEGDTE
jgi:arginine decarboxylase